MKKLSTDTNRPLTPLMWEALDKAASPEGLGSWDYASGILGALKAAGLVCRCVEHMGHGAERSYYRTTESGNARRAIRLMDAADESRSRLGFPPLSP